MDSHGLKPAFAPLCDFRTADGELPAAWAIVRVAHAELVGGNGTEEAWRLTMASEMSKQLEQEHNEGGTALACGVGDEACGEDVTCEARDVYEVRAREASGGRAHGLLALQMTDDQGKAGEA